MIDWMIYYVRKSFNQSIFGETHVSSSAQEFFQIGSDLGDEPFRRCFVIVLTAIIWPFGFVIHSNWMISVSTWIKTTWGPLRIPVIANFFYKIYETIVMTDKTLQSRAPKRTSQPYWEKLFSFLVSDADLDGIWTFLIYIFHITEPMLYSLSMSAHSQKPTFA